MGGMQKVLIRKHGECELHGFYYHQCCADFSIFLPSTSCSGCIFPSEATNTNHSEFC